MSKPFKLRDCLYGHSLDIRSLTVSGNNSIISGSRDKTAKFWTPAGTNSSYANVITYTGQKNFVSSVLYLEPSNQFPEGLVITGGNDKLILIYKPSEPFATHVLTEHTNAVCCLSRGVDSNSFISGSWDTSAKYWCLNKSQSSLVTFSGHLAAVWSVMQLKDSRILTASADKTIGIWTMEGKLLHSLQGHKDCVRGLCDLPELGFFVSVSNDATVKVWSYSGENLDTYYGHTNYIYSIARCKSGGENCFVTSDEDRTVRVWRDGVNTETFHLPAQSVWTVACLSNGDIVTGSSDGIVRIFTQNESRIAEPSMLQKFDEEVGALINQSVQEIGGYKVSDLPGREALFDPGKKPGQMKMIREAHGVVAYTWVEDGDKSHWEKVGEVLGANDKSNEGKTMFEGKSYDFVFSVDVEDGKPPLKLPYNKGDDVYQTANAFITKNNLPPVYLDQVVEFILKNSNDPTLSVAASNDYVDPFTGGSRYTPSSSNGNTSQAGFNLDPLTGSSSYSTSSSSASNVNLVTSGGRSDPFTGGMAYTTTSTKIKKYFPQTKYLAFEMGDPAVILNKLKEFNRKIGDVMCNVDEKCLEEFITICNGPPQYDKTYDVLVLLLEWPDDVLFPVLDVVRLGVRYAKNNEVVSAISSELFLDKLKGYISYNCKIVNNTIVALRTLSNLCLHPWGEQVIFDNRFEIVENITGLGNLNKNAEIALTTLLLNMAVLSENRKDELGISVLMDVLQDIVMKLKDPESQFRSYVAIGTLLLSNAADSKENKLKLKTNFSFIDVLNKHSSLYGSELEEKRMNCAKDVKDIL